MHRQDGPAIKVGKADVWYLNGQRHREHGPAIIYQNGLQEWYLNNERHRKDGPAVIYPNGEEWYLNGKRHRQDGPAIKIIDGREEWWQNGTVIGKIDEPLKMHPVEKE